VINADFTLNDDAYHEYSPVILGTTSVVSYGLGFAAVISVIVHAYLNYRVEIWQGMKATFTRGNSKLQSEDVHSKV
jgi:hypothetical protein